MPNKKKRILVSASPERQKEILDILAEIGFENITTAEPDTDAIIARIGQSVFDNLPFDLLIVGEKLKHHGGKELLRNLRHRHHNETPFILVCYHEPDMVENLQIINLGSVTCLTPPFSRQKLEALIKFLHI